MLKPIRKMTTSFKPTIHVALAECDPLRFVGFRTLLESESDLEIVSASLPEIAIRSEIDVVLIGDRPGDRLVDVISHLKIMRPNLPAIVIGPSTDDEAVLHAVVSGARGYVPDGAAPDEFARAIRTVIQGSVWAPR